MNEGPSGESGYEAMKRSVLVMAGEFTAQRDQAVALERLSRTHPTTRAREREFDYHWEQIMAKALARDNSMNPQLSRLLAGSMMGLIRAGLDLWVESKGKLNLIELAHTAFNILDKGGTAMLGGGRSKRS